MGVAPRGVAMGGSGGDGGKKERYPRRILQEVGRLTLMSEQQLMG